MPQEAVVRIVRALAERGLNADREAVTLLAREPDHEEAIDRVASSVDADTLVVSAADVESALSNPTVSGGETAPESREEPAPVPPETEGSPVLTVEHDMTGESTGTGTYEDFVAVFRDRLDRLGNMLSGRVTDRPARDIARLNGGEQVAMVGLVADVSSTVSGHWRIELEDATGTVEWLVLKDRDEAALVESVLEDEALALSGSLASDGEVAFVDDFHVPDIPRTNEPTTADRPVSAALVSDLHYGSQEFLGEAWDRFTDWLASPDGQHVEYLLVAGDMVEGVGVYPNQDEELSVVDIYDQYAGVSERLKDVPGDIELVMIPGNHDAVRLAEPQPGFDDELRDILSAHDATVLSNPGTVTLDGVRVLMYHGVSLDEVIAEIPSASYDDPEGAMIELLKKRHLAPRFGGHVRVAPEEDDHLLIEEVPDVFHAGHVHKLGVGSYRGVLAVNSGCWQAQTAFQRSVNIDPDAGFAPILDLESLEVTIQKFT